MKKKIVVSLVSVIVVLAAAGGFFYWRENIRLTPVEEWNTVVYTDAKDYIVTDTPQGKVVGDNKTVFQ